MKETSDKIMTRLDRDTYKELQKMKIDLDMKTVSDVITMLVDNYINEADRISQAIRNTTM